MFKTRWNGIVRIGHQDWYWHAKGHRYVSVWITAVILLSINLPFALVFIEFCFNCWCFDFQDCNFLISRFIIGDELRFFLTFLIFLSMTSRFPFIFVFWKQVYHKIQNNTDKILWLHQELKSESKKLWPVFSPGCQIWQTGAELRRGIPRADHYGAYCSC